MKTCCIDGCERPAVAHGWCATHYRRWKKHGDPSVVKQRQLHGATLAERVIANIQKSDGCWEWTGYRDPNGYGRLNVNHVPALAHRLAWEVFCRPLKDDEQVLHRCDNPPCCRPDHLFIGNPGANTADKMLKGRHRYGISQGEKHGCAVLTEADVVAIRRSKASHEDIAREFGVSRRHVNDIVNRRVWKHI